MACLTAHGLLRSLMTSVNVLTTLYSASLIMIGFNYVTLYVALYDLNTDVIIMVSYLYKCFVLSK